MKINFTKKEYKALLTALYISDWVMHCFEIEKDPETQKYRDLEQRILSFAKDFGMDDWVEWDAKYDEYFHTQEFEDEVMKFIEKYNENFFWDELASRLAKRDLMVQYSKEAVFNMSLEERYRICCDFEEGYIEEFENNGLANLILKKRKGS